ncbi:hypothetical protein BKA70DRAFT_1559234 [Coprinopsis sp. MPI-PUGE-AT-0042]|nr:hypothetical protein BKA70DRAFT_1559234 [Coprinopsis sp. MPI-PUGE-AT-0042]
MPQYSVQNQDERTPLLAADSENIAAAASCSYLPPKVVSSSKNTTGHSTPLLARPQQPACTCHCRTPREESSTALETQPKTRSSGSYWASLLDSEYIALNLENSGSVARDHLASERTFLAYVRTSLAVASSGVALIQLFTVASRGPLSNAHEAIIAAGPGVERFIRPLGCTTVLIGISILAIGVARYFIVQSALTRGKYPAARLAIGFLAIAMTALVSLTFAVMMASNLDTRD